ncbi:MAG: 3-deoxy-D-manno-octulosonic acid transferase [Parachlamydiaceae bacterium]|nr:3-deoxy-D-manno-octulosonic acid transferase [Parachlamydiaceae bacterium]
MSNIVNVLFNFFVSVLYECSLILIALVALPKLIYQFIMHKKYRASLLTRLGIRYPKIEKNNHRTVWIHAVSVGEAKAIVSLAREIKQLFPESQLIISSTTETGHMEAKRSLPFADKHVYLPLDLRCIVSPIISKASPDLVILSESDFWYNFLSCAKNKGAVIALVNGKISEKSMNRFCQVPFFSKRLMNLFDIMCLQNESYKERFIKIFSPIDKMVITGNLKLDDEYPQLSNEDVQHWRKRLGIDPAQPVLTIGSSHNPEEQIFLDVLKRIWKKFPTLKVILVPRHPERFKDVAALLDREHIQSIKFSEIQRKTGKEQVILIDTMGMLRMCYQLSDIAIVGGSYTSKVGGHNILEPCWYGKPVLFGPYMHTQVELVGLIKHYEAGFQVNPDELEKKIEDWLSNPVERDEVGRKGLRLIKEVKGSTKRTMSALEPLLSRLQK